MHKEHKEMEEYLNTSNNNNNSNNNNTNTNTNSTNLLLTRSSTINKYIFLDVCMYNILVYFKYNDI